MAAQLKYTPEHCQMAEDILASGKSLAAVCAKFNIARCTLYEWRENHPDFKMAIDKGLQKCQAEWEEIGRNGISGETKGFGAAPWIFTMKNRFRDDYKEDKEPSKVESAVEKLILSKLID